MRRKMVSVSEGEFQDNCKYGYNIIVTNNNIALDLWFLNGFLSEKDVEFFHSLYKLLSNFDNVCQNYFFVKKEIHCCFNSFTVKGSTIAELFTNIDTISSVFPLGYGYIGNKTNSIELSPLKKDIIANVKDMFESGNSEVREAYEFCSILLA